MAPPSEDPPAGPQRRLEAVESLLAARGRDLAHGRIRVAVGRSGVAVAFPRRPMIHVSWWALVPLAALPAARVVRRRRRTAR